MSDDVDAQLVHCLAARTLADEILDVLSVMEASLRRFLQMTRPVQFLHGKSVCKTWTLKRELVKTWNYGEILHCYVGL